MHSNTAPGHYRNPGSKLRNLNTVGSRPPTTQSLIVGFGRAGRDLHLMCLRKAQNKHKHLMSQRVGVVDPRIDYADVADGTISFFRHLEEVSGFDPATTVVHICTPPGQHLAVLRQVSELGYTKILMEKPLVTSLDELDELVHLDAQRNLDILVVANWLSSSLTAQLKSLIDSGQFGPLESLEIEQHKPRFSRTLANPGHTNAFDVEMPHQTALALYLAGQHVEVIEAQISDMKVGSVIIPRMGMARLEFLHAGGVRSVLCSSLMAPYRKRSVKLTFAAHQVVGYYPASGDDSYSVIKHYDQEGHLLHSDVLEDDVLTNAFIEYYRYYSRSTSKPVSDLTFNTAVISTISQAKALCGISTRYIRPAI